MRRLVPEGWTRTALLSCAVLVLSIVGAASQALGPRTIAAHLNGTLVDASRAADHGIRSGQAGPRIAVDRRQIEPGFDRAPPPDIAAPRHLVDVAIFAGVRLTWADTTIVRPFSHRFAHRPRGPPQGDPLSGRSSLLDRLAHELRNGGVDRAHGQPSLKMG